MLGYFSFRPAKCLDWGSYLLLNSVNPYNFIYSFYMSLVLMYILSLFPFVIFCPSFTSLISKLGYSVSALIYSSWNVANLITWLLLTCFLWLGSVSTSEMNTLVYSYFLWSYLLGLTLLLTELSLHLTVELNLIWSEFCEIGANLYYVRWMAGWEKELMSLIESSVVWTRLMNSTNVYWMFLYIISSNTTLRIILISRPMF